VVLAQDRCQVKICAVPLGGGQSGLLDLIPANRVAASANNLASAAAVSGKRCGWMTLGLLGHLTMTTAGVWFASINSTVIVSVAVSWPLASSVTLDIGISAPL
jgi:hypothetical protein